MENVIEIDLSDLSNNRPKGRMKSDVNSLDSLPKFNIKWSDFPEIMEEGLYNFKIGVFEHDIVYLPSNENRLFVFFSGDANRQKFTPPVFQRWSWSNIFPGHCLYISDPTLKQHENLSLAWYVGTEEVDLLPNIAEIINRVAENLDIPLQNVIAYGSSGGGFAALRLSSILQDIITVPINPQIDITKYHNKLVEKMLNRCYDKLDRNQAYTLFPKRFNIASLSEEIANNKIIYIQNRLDSHHYEIHFPIFSKAMGLNDENNYKKNNIEAVFFDHPKGHGAPEPKEIINVILEKVLAWT